MPVFPAEYHAASNSLPKSLPDVAPVIVDSAHFLRSLRPLAFVMGVGASVGTQLWRVREKSVIGVVIGLSAAAIISASSTMDRFLLHFDRLRTHVLTQRRNSDTKCVVTRQGVQKMVSQSCLIPGDIIHLTEGRVPADCRILESCDLRIDSSFLPHRNTQEGRGHLVTAVAERENSSVLEANCVALATSLVTGGSATAVVARTADDTAVCLLVARLASLSPLQVLLSPWI